MCLTKESISKKGCHGDMNDENDEHQKGQRYVNHMPQAEDAGEGLPQDEFGIVPKVGSEEALPGGDIHPGLGLNDRYNGR